MIRRIPMLVTCLIVIAGPACDDTTEQTLVRSDGPSVDRSWPSELEIYKVEFLSEGQILANLGMQDATRTTIDADLHRYLYEKAGVELEIYFDNGMDRPFHSLRYSRTGQRAPLSWNDPEELERQWERATETAALFIQKLTTLAPLVWVEAMTREDALGEGGLAFGLFVEGRPVWVNDFVVVVDQDGVYSLETDEMPYSVVSSQDAEPYTYAEIQAILDQRGLKDAGPEALMYGFSDDDLALHLLYLASDDEDHLEEVRVDKGAGD